MTEFPGLGVERGYWQWAQGLIGVTEKLYNWIMVTAATLINDRVDVLKIIELYT